MQKRKEILKQASIYSFGAQLAQLITMAAAILSRRFLGPTQMGIWTALQIIVDYSKYSTLGTMHAVAREIPYEMGRGNRKAAEEIQNLVFTIILTGAGLTALGILVFMVVSGVHFSPEIRTGLFFIALIICLQRMSDFLIGLLRCYKKFTLASSQLVLSAVVNGILVAGFTYWLKIYGFMWAMTLSFIFNIAFIQFRDPFKFKLVFKSERLRPLIAFGFPLMIVGIMTTFMRNIDEIMVVKVLGFKSLGYYSLAPMLCTYINNFLNAIAVVYIPHLQEKFSVQNDPKDLKNYIFKATEGYALTIPIGIGIAWIVAPYFVALLLPQFVAGIPAMKLLILGMFFLSLAQPYSDFLITIKKHLALFPALAATCAVSFALNGLAIWKGYGPMGVAGATACSYFVFFLGLYVLAAPHFLSKKEAIHRFFGFMAYWVYLLAILLLITRILPTNYHSIRQTGFQAAFFALAYLPMLWQLNRKFGLLPLLLDKLRRSRVPPSLVVTGSPQEPSDAF